MFITKSNRKDIIKAVEAANNLVTSQLLYQGILNFPEQIFASSNISPANLCNYIKVYFVRADVVIEVHTYRYWRRGVYGMYDRRYPNRVYINTRSLPRSNGSLVATIIHEMVHMVEKLVQQDLPGKKFNHGSNRYRPWKSKTAQYYTDNVAEGIIDSGSLVKIPKTVEGSSGSNIIIKKKKSIWETILDIFVFWR